MLSPPLKSNELSPVIISRDAWMEGLSSGKLSLTMSFPGFGKYGSPSEPWDFAGRTLPFHVVHLPLKGRIRLRVSATEYLVEPGSFLWMSAGVTHDISRLDTSHPLTMYHVRVAVHRRDGTPCRMPEDVIILPHALAIHRLFEVWFGESAHTRDNAGAIGLGLFLQTFGYLFAGLNEAAVGPRFTSVQQMALRRLLDERSGHLPTPADLATRLGLSHTYFSRVFKVTFGVAPRVWIAGERMRAACTQLVESRRSITAIGEALGYADIYSFSRQFRRAMGCSPREFRQRHYIGGPMTAPNEDSARGT